MTYGLPEDGVSVSGNNSSLEGLLDVGLDGSVGSILTDLGLHAADPKEDLLVGESVEGTSESVHGSGVGEERVGEGGSDKVTSVGGNVTSLVIGVEGKVESHELTELLVVTESENGSEVGRVILGHVDGGHLSLNSVGVAEDTSSDVGELGNEVHGVLEGRAPVVLLGDTGLVCLGESRVVVESDHGDAELRHGVEGRRAVVEELLDELGDGATGGPVLGEDAGLLDGGDLSGEEEPEEGLREGLVTTRGTGELGLALGDGLATETNSLLCVSRQRQAPCDNG